MTTFATATSPSFASECVGEVRHDHLSGTVRTWGSAVCRPTVMNGAESHPYLPLSERHSGQAQDAREFFSERPLVPVRRVPRGTHSTAGETPALHKTRRRSVQTALSRASAPPCRMANFAHPSAQAVQNQTRPPGLRSAAWKKVLRNPGHVSASLREP